MIIAFTSDFIPRLIYTLKYSPDHSLQGYVNYTLSYFNTADFSNITRPQHYNTTDDVAVCRCKLSFSLFEICFNFLFSFSKAIEI